jgi:uncharacterized small protein (DUF1192 family)
MTDTPEITAIRAAMRMFESATCTTEIEDALDAFELASGPEEMARLINYIDGLQAEIARLKSDNARLLSDVTRPESIDVGLMRAEIGRLRKDAARYQWLKKHPQWLGWEHNFRPDEVEREIDVAMKGETP